MSDGNSERKQNIDSNARGEVELSDAMGLGAIQQVIIYYHPSKGNKLCTITRLWNTRNKFITTKHFQVFWIF